MKGEIKGKRCDDTSSLVHGTFNCHGEGEAETHECDDNFGHHCTSNAHLVEHSVLSSNTLLLEALGNCLDATIHTDVMNLDKARSFE